MTPTVIRTLLVLLARSLTPHHIANLFNTNEARRAAAIFRLINYWRSLFPKNMSERQRHGTGEDVTAVDISG